MSATKLNKRFVQLSDPDGILAQEALTRANPAAATLFLFFMRKIDADNCLIVSQDIISEYMRTSVRTAQRAIKFLKDNNYIQVFKSGSSNVYTLNADIVWKSDGEGRVNALLTGKVMLSLVEQEPEVIKDVRRRLGNHLKQVK